MEELKNRIEEFAAQISPKNELDYFELLDIKSEVNMLKSECYMKIDLFSCKAEAYYYINKCNSLIAKICYFEDYNKKLYDEIIRACKDNVELKGFVKECRKKLKRNKKD